MFDYGHKLKAIVVLLADRPDSFSVHRPTSKLGSILSIRVYTTVNPAYQTTRTVYAYRIPTTLILS